MRDTESVRTEQLAYYRAIAGEYEDHAIDALGRDELLSAIDAFQPAGDVLELACGPGVWTERLLRSASTVTAVDGAPEMLARARARLASNQSVRFVEADLFSWRPDRRYDAICFGFWISHVPEARFEHFWSVVADALQPAGTVFFFDDTHRTDDELRDGDESPFVWRRTAAGTTFRVVKIPYEPAALEQRLRAMGWNIEVHGSSGPFYWGIGGR
jgi:SAM-dependent methyltransferase